jgi:hypothetical protein
VGMDCKQPLSRNILDVEASSSIKLIHIDYSSLNVTRGDP